MIFLPVVERELRVASRRTRTYYTRMGGAIAAVVIGGWIMLAMQYATPQTIGMTLFKTLGGLILLYAAFEGIRVTADCLSEEKREGTLGLLFLTDLKGYDVVFGKLAANSLASVYGLLGAFPVLAIPLLMGGVSYGEFGRVILTALNLLFLSLSVGMFASASCRNERKAGSTAVLVLLGLMFSPLMVGWWIDNQPGQSFPEVLAVFSPGTAALMAFDPMYGTSRQIYWAAVAVSHVYGWLFLALASFILPRTWQDKAVSSKMTVVQETWRDVSEGALPRRVAFRRLLLDLNPFYWLAARDRIKEKLVWGMLLCAALLWLWGLAEWKDDWINPGTHIVTAIALHTVLKFWIAGEACRRFVEDRRNGAMELMLSTPLSVEEILRGQLQALKRQFAGPVVVVVVLDLLFMMDGLREKWSGDIDAVWVVTCLAGIVVFVYDMVALSWVAMWTGLTSPAINRASGGAISRILVIPWLAWGMLMTGVGIMAASGVFLNLNLPSIPEFFIPLSWLLVSIFNNVFWVKWAKGNLRSRMRDVATQRMGSPGIGIPFLKRLYGKHAGTPPPVPAGNQG